MLLFSPTDQETSATEKIGFYSQLLRGGAIPHKQVSHGEAPGSVRRQKEQEESMDKKLYCGFHVKERTKQVSRFRLSSLNNFGGLWSVAALCTCLVPGPE